MRSLIFRSLAATWLGFLVVPASGAEISEVVPSRFADVILEGKIETGDYEKLLGLIELINAGCGSKYEGCAGRIYLASPRGSVTEAMKIGRLVRALRWKTIIPSPITNAYVRLENIFENYRLNDPNSNHLCASARGIRPSCS